MNILTRIEPPENKDKDCKKNPKVLLDEKIVIDVILKSESNYLADEYEILDLALSGEIDGFLTAKGLEEIKYICNDYLNQEKTNKLIEKLSKSLTIYHLNHSTKIKQQLAKSGSKGLNQKELILCALDTGIKTIVSPVSPKNFIKFGQQLELNQEQPINILKPAEFLEWYDLDEEERFPLSAYEPSRVEVPTVLDEIDRNEIDSWAVNKARLELEEKLGASFTISSDRDDETIKIGDYHLENYEVHCFQSDLAVAKVTLWNDKTQVQLSNTGRGVGPLNAVCRAFDQLISPIISTQLHHIDVIKLNSIEKGLNSPVAATVVLKHKNSFYQGTQIHRDTIKAAFFAYAKAFAKVQSQTNLKLTTTDFYNANLAASDLSGSDLSGIDLIDADLQKANLMGAILDRAKLIHAKMAGTMLQSASLCEAILSQAMLEEANFAFARLDKANLSNVFASKAIFCYGVLTKANLYNAILVEADLTEANLSEANLAKADLTGANLTGANLVGTNLDGTNLEDANLTKARVDIAIMKATLSNTIMPNGRIYQQYSSIPSSYGEFEQKYIHKCNHVLSFCPSTFTRLINPSSITA